MNLIPWFVLSEGAQSYSALLDSYVVLNYNRFVLKRRLVSELFWQQLCKAISSPDRALDGTTSLRSSFTHPQDWEIQEDAASFLIGGYLVPLDPYPKSTADLLRIFFHELDEYEKGFDRRRCSASRLALEDHYS